MAMSRGSTARRHIRTISALFSMRPSIEMLILLAAAAAANAALNQMVARSTNQLAISHLGPKNIMANLGVSGSNNFSPVANLHEYSERLPPLPPPPLAPQNNAGPNQMAARSSQLAPTHFGPKSGLVTNMGPSEAHNFNSIASLQDYPERLPPLAQNHNGQSHQMSQRSNHQLGVPHLGPSKSLMANMIASESNNYNSIANLQDYPERLQPSPQNSGQIQDPGHNNNGPNGNGISGQKNNLSPAPSSSSSAHQVIGDDLRGNYNNNNNEYQGDQSSFEPNASVRSSSQSGSSMPLNDQASNSRSSVSDGYMRLDHKGREAASENPLRSGPIDPFEDMATGLSTSEYERDLADLDEEFNRHSYRRPSASLMSDSYISISPERYEGRRYTRRPPSYDYSGDYLSTAGSMSSIIPRSYQRSPWSSGSSYSDNSDLFAVSNADFSPMPSYINPNHYTYRWRPRYQRISPYSSSPYLTTSASEQHLQHGYNIVPSYNPPVPTETISIALSPLAAAAAAAASALAAADKSRHPNHGWLALPRLTATSSITPAATTATATTASHTAHAPAAAVPATAIQTAYIHRPGPYALSSMPIYAIAPRPTAPLATAASAAPTSYIPYFHGGAPAIIAYRPTGVIPSASLLTSASFAYPLRYPVGALPRPAPLGMAGPGMRPAGSRPFYSDLQYAESKSKSNLSNSSDGKAKGGGLSAMAKNLTRKMFGSASQVRPQHVSPPGSPSTDSHSPPHNSSAASSS